MTRRDVLTVDNLTLTFSVGGKERTLVRNLSFSISENRTMGLIGESGCGKSLTCLAIMGLLPRSIRMTGGEILLWGKPLTQGLSVMHRSMRGRDLAMILQNPMSCFDSVFTIRHHFMETYYSHERASKDKPGERIAEALKAVGFDQPDDVLDLYPFQMSGGMLQRVMVALALLMRVPFLIADEPTTDLDVVSQSRILDLLDQVRKRYDMSVLLVTHDLGVIARLADEVVVMQNGNRVDGGAVGSLFRSSEHPYTRAILEAHLSFYDDRFQKIRSSVQQSEQEVAPWL
ncbi:nickel import ATP-binding protein NikD [Desulfatiferula olefinivorans]